ncbi:TPA: hypothetical protein ACGVB5_004693 [Vibrio vulnificus]|uniref:hypothetical protein n=1 Tax=Vibrio parahaemolyticus TaxID=670 RepID=UPI001A24CDB6|nr:hypothetical protein [Vibrio parahaemolyticus]HAS6355107.1 hypothetical protein [Vibrio vulnificus]MDF4348574.1 hypothetical protein [Vibrio parahaemolyticus]MEA5328011.1 hypothetical protein [Vibrio parahaemolyticus]HAS6368981.1 hypothetical protein [Vibrio vulnificus]HDY7612898.1 hypothetical protein [Vibrio vulnificus]
MDRLYVALIALILGWGLSQLTEYVKSKQKTKKLKSAIELELRDLEELLKQRENTAKSSALNYGHNHNYAFSLGAPISTPVLDAFYAEVAASFTNEQRYNIRVFRDHVRAYSCIVEWAEEMGSGYATQNEIVFKLFEAYKQASFALVYIKEVNKVGGREKIADDHESLNKLRESFKELTPKLALKES